MPSHRLFIKIAAALETLLHSKLATVKGAISVTTGGPK